METIHKLNAELRNLGVSSKVRSNSSSFESDREAYNPHRQDLYVEGDRVENLSFSGENISGRLNGAWIERETVQEFAEVVAKIKSVE